MTEKTAVEAQEIEATSDGYILVPIAGYDGVTKDVHVLLATKWRSSAFRALHQGNFDEFMRLVLHEDDFETYIDLDPDAEAIGHFTDQASERTGEALGKSSGPSRSSKNTRKR